MVQAPAAEERCGVCGHTVDSVWVTCHYDGLRLDCTDSRLWCVMAVARHGASQVQVGSKPTTQAPQAKHQHAKRACFAPCSYDRAAAYQACACSSRSPCTSIHKLCMRAACSSNC